MCLSMIFKGTFFPVCVILFPFLTVRSQPMRYQENVILYNKRKRIKKKTKKTSVYIIYCHKKCNDCGIKPISHLSLLDGRHFMKVSKFTRIYKSSTSLNLLSFLILCTCIIDTFFYESPRLFKKLVSNPDVLYLTNKMCLN